MVVVKDEKKVQNTIKVISGGQTGVDRAALDAALANGFEIGGFCPNGRMAEDGIITTHYPLEVVTPIFLAKWSEVDPDDLWAIRNVTSATHVLCLSPTYELFGGTERTYNLTRDWFVPVDVIAFDPMPTSRTMRMLLNSISPIVHLVLRVAGPQESKWPGGHARALAFLDTFFRGCKRSLQDPRLLPSDIFPS